MEDRHLFRGKLVSSNKWVYGHYAFIENKHYILINHSNKIKKFASFFKHEVIPKTVGLCTGITAAKSYRGTEHLDLLVFDKDRIEFNSRKGTINQNISGEWQIQWDDGPTGTLLSYIHKNIEIIGTIHENDNEADVRHGGVL